MSVRPYATPTACPGRKHPLRQVHPDDEARLPNSRRHLARGQTGPGGKVQNPLPGLRVEQSYGPGRLPAVHLTLVVRRRPGVERPRDPARWPC